MAISMFTLHSIEKFTPLVLQTSTVVLNVSYWSISDTSSVWVVFDSLSRDSHAPRGEVYVGLIVITYLFK